jgi:cytochrome c oxidase cbb3-type subunit 3
MRFGGVVFVVFVAISGCDRAPSPTGQWSPLDHDKAPAQQQGQQAPPSGSNRPTTQQQLAEAAWMQTCTTCHGPLGRGDGPQGSLVKAPDLTRMDWQTKVSDADIAARIKNGKGLMPPNDLPDSTIRGLVARIRALRGTQQ